MGSLHLGASNVLMLIIIRTTYLLTVCHRLLIIYFFKRLINLLGLGKCCWMPIKRKPETCCFILGEALVSVEIWVEIWGLPGFIFA